MIQPQYSPILWWPSSYAIQTWPPSQAGHTLQTTWLVAKRQTPQHIINQPHYHHHWLIHLQQYIAITAWWRADFNQHQQSQLSDFCCSTYSDLKVLTFNNVTTNGAKFCSFLCVFVLPLKNINRPQEHWIGIGTQQDRRRWALNLQVWHSTTWPLVHQLKITNNTHHKLCPDNASTTAPNHIKLY